MKEVAKYNTYKGVSTVLTMGTPIATLAACGDMFIHRSDTAISAAGMFAILLTLLFAKDKIAEYFKAPSALVLSGVTLILIVIIEHILLPMKYVCITTLIASGIDEITFKNWYKRLEYCFKDDAKQYKKIGFLFTTTDKVLKEESDGKSGEQS